MLKRKNMMTFGLFALLAVIFTMAPDVALAQTAPGVDDKGASFLNAFAGGMESNFGLMVGLILAALGLWRWLMSQDSWGVMMIVGGIVITAFPGIFEGLYKSSSTFFTAMGSEANYSSDDITGVE